MNSASLIKKFVLLVEDDQDLSEVLIYELKQMNFDVLSTPSGQKATEIIKEMEQVDLIIADYNLAGPMSGLDLVYWTRQIDEPRKKKTKFILMTGNFDQFDSQQAADLGVLDYLPKPFDAHHFRQALSDILDAGPD